MKNNLILGTIGLLLGVIIGFYAANSMNRSAVQGQSSAAISPMQGAPGGNADAMSGAMPQVAEKLKKADESPNDFAAQMEAAQMFTRIDRMDKAGEYFARAAKIKPEDHDANLNAGNAMYDAHNFEKAREFYEAALKIKPDQVGVITDYGTTFVEQSSPDYKRAIQEFEKALKIDPKSQPTLFNLAIAYAKSGDMTNAKLTYEKVVALNPSPETLQKLKSVLNL